MRRSSDSHGSRRILAQTPRPRSDGRSRENRWQRFYRVVRCIPSGRVSTYGEVAERAGLPRFARHVGYALAALRGGPHGVPWQRVLGKRGRLYAGISLKDPVGAAIQQKLLAAEGVEFDAQGRVSLELFGWGPEGQPEILERPALGPPAPKPRQACAVPGSLERAGAPRWRTS